MRVTKIKSKRFHWEWVGITFASYLVFYFLPILLMVGAFSDNLTGPSAAVFVGGWSFGGPIILSAIAGYVSKGKAQWEVTVAAFASIVLLLITDRVFLVPKQFEVHNVSAISSGAGSIAGVLVVVVLSWLGAWFGIRLWKTQNPVTTKKP